MWKRGGTSTVHASSAPQRFFRLSTVARDWHQKKDEQGKFYYYNIFTEETTREEPKLFLPWNAKKESPFMRYVPVAIAPTAGWQHCAARCVE
jgi:hypothetical protein